MKFAKLFKVLSKDQDIELHNAYTGSHTFYMDFSHIKRKHDITYCNGSDTSILTVRGMPITELKVELISVWYNGVLHIYLDNRENTYKKYYKKKQKKSNRSMK